MNAISGLEGLEPALKIIKHTKKTNPRVINHLWLVFNIKKS